MDSTGNIEEGASLEGDAPAPGQSGGGAAGGSAGGDANKPTDTTDPAKKSAAPQSTNSNNLTGFKKIKHLLSRVNIYFLLFLLIVVIALMVVFIGIQTSKKQSGS